MTAKSSKCSFHIKKQAITNMKYFVYQDKLYSVNFDLLKMNSLYFYKNQEKFKEKNNIELMGEHEKYIKLTDESIEAFISSCQNEPCSIENSSIIPLQYLAHKFEFNALIQFTDKYIEEHSEDLIFEILFFKIDEMKVKSNNYSFFDTSKEEHFISDHLPEYIQKEETLNLPITVLYRIFALFYENNQNKDEIKNDVTTFIFKCLDKYGKPASALFSFIDFGEQRIEVVNRLLENYSEKFDFNLINKTLTTTVKDLTSEVNKQKEEYKILFKQMQETFKEQLAELKEMKKQEEDKQKQNEIDYKKRIENFSSDIEKIKNGIDEKMISIQDQFKQICKKQEEFIDNAAVKKYHQMILETITYGQFCKFDDKLKDHFLTELLKIENKKTNQEFCKFDDKLKDNFLTELYKIENKQINQLFKIENIPMIQIFKRNVEIKITKNKIEDVFQKGQLNSCLTNCINLSDDVLVEIEYPCNKFEQIMKIISDIKLQNKQKMKVSFTINNKSYFEQKNECNKIVNIYKVGKSIDVIPEKALENSSLKQIIIPSSVTEIGNSAFRGCSLLTQITIPSSVTKIGEYTFYGCSSLTQISIPSSVTKIGNVAFGGCSSLTQILIPSSVTEIERYAFGGCSSLTQISIPSSVTKIGYNAFEGCSSLTQISIPSSVTEIGNFSFKGCSSLTQISIPSSVTKIGSNAFEGCSSLTQISIPSSVTYIGDGFLANCLKKRIEYFENTFIAFKANQSSKIYDTIIWVKHTINALTIPSFVTKIGNYAFDGCSSLTQISIPSSVTKIGYNAFEGCSSLTQISIPSSVTEIGNSAFKGCSSLTQISIPSSVTKIGYNAFEGCSSLTQISIPSSVTEIGNNAFKGCSSLTQISIPSSVTKIGNYAFGGCSSLTQISIPSSVTEIGNSAFEGCSSLTQISIPSSVTKIEPYAFERCSSLTQISIPSSVTEIGNDAFRGCSSLTQITIPSRINSNNLGINSNVTINRI
ncbi:hypothetical protein M9Y10_023817 [Tritrichomonas musculus]|uniref:Surface antigen BspA-like n=1 Tax=Tritrichomonas musculus TaxID=1915356 RepID=A0ABR2KZB7_9EUKA